MEPLATFRGFGKKGATEVEIYPDRVEWVFKSHRRAGSRMFGGGADKTEMMPIRVISSVTTERAGLGFEKLSLIATGNTVDFKLSKKDAQEAKDLIHRLILEI